jgi:hypothetical protein
MRQHLLQLASVLTENKFTGAIAVVERAAVDDSIQYTTDEAVRRLPLTPQAALASCRNTHRRCESPRITRSPTRSPIETWKNNWR